MNNDQCAGAVSRKAGGPPNGGLGITRPTSEGGEARASTLAYGADDTEVVPPTETESRGRGLVEEEPVEAEVLDCGGEAFEVHGFHDVAVHAEVVALDDVALFFR